MKVFVDVTGGSKVDDLDGGTFGVDEEDVLGLEIAVNHADVRTREED